MVVNRENDMTGGVSDVRLRLENLLFRGTGGRSEENRNLGFRPAFFDYATQRLYLSCYRNGLPAPVHLLHGLPDEVVCERAENGRVVHTKPTLVAGFVRNGFFYTRRAAARAAQEWQ
jgi:hypothetical protein